MSLKDHVAVVGVGVKYHAPGEGAGVNPTDLAIEATQVALADAGLSQKDLQNLAWASGSGDPGGMAAAMGVPEVSFSVNLTSGTSGAGSLALAASSIVGGFGEVCLSVIATQSAPSPGTRSSSLYRANYVAGPGAYGGMIAATPEDAFTRPAGISTQGITQSLIAASYLQRYGLPRDHFGEVVVTQRANAGEALSMDDYLAAPLVAGPLCDYDGTPDLEGSFAVAVITTTLERARDLRQPPVVIASAAIGGTPSRATLLQAPADDFVSAGHRAVAADLWAMADIGPDDVDLALLDDDFSPMVLMQLEEYGFCAPGEAGSFVAGGNAALGGKLPVNTHGGNLSRAYVQGATHVVEAVEQLRGTAAKPVDGAEVALVTGAPPSIPQAAVLLRKA